MPQLLLKNWINNLGLIPRFKNYFSSDKEFYLLIRQVLKYRPKNLGLFKLALTHKSASKKLFNHHFYNNERLEYLGDSILNTVISDLLYQYYPHKDEGFLTKMRSKIVSRESLNSIAEEMGLDRILFQRINDYSCTNILGNAFEAVIGAIYIDGGFNKVKTYITNKVVFPYVDFKLYERIIFDYKSHLIEWSQKNDMEVTFEDIEKENMSLNQPLFLSKVKLFDRTLGSGTGYSKKEAQQNAAKEAYDLYIES
jgi:ribonuclease-3